MDKFLSLVSEYEGNVKLGGLQIQTLIGVIKQQRSCNAFAAENRIQFVNHNETHRDQEFDAIQPQKIENIAPQDLESLGIGILASVPGLFPKLQKKHLLAISTHYNDLCRTLQVLETILHSMCELEKSILAKASFDKIGNPAEITVGLAYKWLSEALVGYKLDVHGKRKILGNLATVQDVESLISMQSDWNNCDEINLKIQVLISERLKLARTFD